MAYYNQDDDEDLSQNGQQIGKESATIDGVQNAGNENANALKKPDNPGNFVGINQYLNQNKNQTGKITDSISNYTNSMLTSAQDALTKGTSGYNAEVDRNTVNLNQGLFNEAQNNAENVVKDQNKVTEFQKMRDAQYNGPSAFVGTDYYQPGKQAIDKASQYAKNLQTIEGQNQALNDIQKKGRYSKGVSTLDSALIGSDPYAQSKLGEFGMLGDNLSQNLSAAEEAGANRAAEAKRITDLTRNSVLGKFAGDNSIQNQLQNTITSRASGISQQGLTDARKLQDKLQGNANTTLTDRDNSLLDAGNELNSLRGRVNDINSYGTGSNYNNLANYAKLLTGTERDKLVNPQNVANADEYARYGALNQLMGTSNDFLKDPSQAGKYDDDFLNFDTAKAKSELSAEQKNKLLGSISKKAGDSYYNQLGQHTGQGTAGAYNGRDVASLVNSLITQNRDLSSDENARFFEEYRPIDNYRVDSLKKSLLDMINQGRQKYQTI